MGYNLAPGRFPGLVPAVTTLPSRSYGTDISEAVAVVIGERQLRAGVRALAARNPCALGLGDAVAVSGPSLTRSGGR